ncbi:MAG: insulinase family protein, partial [Chitinophagia bacterium]|nr:insulinase family protein [Chitinophagia bacterium]
MFKASLKAALLVVACCPFVATSAFSQNLAAPLPHDPAVVTGKLPNGLTYYIKQNSKPTNKVELRLVVKAGSVLETDQQRGLAHFMEHMNFNGTKNFRKNELVSYLQSIGVQFGADLNAYTAFDQTVYILPIPTDRNGNLEKGFQIIEDWAHNATLSDSDIDGERGVVLEESRLGKGANDRMMKQYFPRITQGTIYAERLPIGTDDVLRNFTYDKIRSFYTDWYRPDLQAVIVVGDIAPNEAKKL